MVERGEGRALVPAGGELAPTGRDQVIRADLARGVPRQAVAEEWGLDPAVIDYIAEDLRRGAPAAGDQETSYERLLDRMGPPPSGGGRSEVPDPDDRRDPRAVGYHRDRLSPNTLRTWRGYAGKYLDYCAMTGRREVPGNRFTVEAFTIWLAEKPVTRGPNKGKIGLAPWTLRVALCAVAALHRACGENPPDRYLARGIIEGHAKRRLADPDIHDDVGSPGVDLPTFAEMVAACPPDTNAGVRDRSLFTMGLNLMARRSELCGLDLADVVVRSNRRWMDVRVRRVKGGGARDVKIPAWADMPELDPIAAWEAWRQRLADLGIVDGSAFPPVDRWDNVAGAGPWAGRPSLGFRLDGSSIEHIVLRAALAAQVPQAEELSPHGVFRRSGASLAYNAGADILAIARHGGWMEQSPVVFRYIKDIDAERRNPFLLLNRGLLEPSD